MLWDSWGVFSPQQSHFLLHTWWSLQWHKPAYWAFHWLPSVFRPKTKVLAVTYNVGIWSDSSASLSDALSTLATIVFPQPLRFASFHIRTQVLPSASNPWLAPPPLVDKYSSFRVDQKVTSQGGFSDPTPETWLGSQYSLHGIKMLPSSLYPNCTEHLACTLLFFSFSNV